MDFESWYTTEHPRLLAWLTVAAADEQLAQDIAAETFARAYARWRRVRRMEAPSGWAWRVALNLLRRHHRRRALEDRLLRRRQVDAVEFPTEVEPELWLAVRSLPSRQRSVVALRYVDDLSQAEIAALLGVSPGTVSATLVAARRRLATMLAVADESVEVSDDPAR